MVSDFSICAEIVSRSFSTFQKPNKLSVIDCVTCVYGRTIMICILITIEKKQLLISVIVYISGCKVEIQTSTSIRKYIWDLHFFKSNIINCCGMQRDCNTLFNQSIV